MEKEKEGKDLNVHLDGLKKSLELANSRIVEMESHLAKLEVEKQELINKNSQLKIENEMLLKRLEYNITPALHTPSDSKVVLDPNKSTQFMYENYRMRRK